MKKVNPVRIISKDNPSTKKRGAISNGVKALVLLSGGLDSMLAVKLLQEQGVEVTGLSFISCFFGAGKAEVAVKQLGIKLKKVDFKIEHLKMTKNPKYGYGKNANPCIDCHSLMLRYAGELEGYDFIATGEVLGQRPMSQNKNALTTVAKYSGLNDKLLRPLSAKLLPETEIEKKGLVDRNKLLDISGRSRTRQTELATKYNLKYPSPAGGCLLTDPNFSERLLEMFKRWPDCKSEDIELLKYGRIFWANKTLIVVGRDKEDNEALEKLAKKGDATMELVDVNGPLTLIRNVPYQISNIKLEIPKKLDVDKLKLDEISGEKGIIETAGLLTGWYAPKAREKNIKLNINYK